ncbi:MAG: ribonuclease H [Parcubacteria group bacterium]|nr:ribonuclease H [Parcubacteria group bacterium]
MQPNRHAPICVVYYKTMKKLITYTDGGARGNPGPAAIGVVVMDENKKEIESFGKYIGHKTNNQAEYLALLAAVEKVRDMGATEVTCYLDSELVVKQMNREYKVKNNELASIFVKIWNVATGFDRITYKHVRREQNKKADTQVNKALDNRS